nr:GH3 auxin-responsive promoter family protein [Micromonospora sp. DSM 115978]
MTGTDLDRYRERVFAERDRLRTAFAHAARSQDRVLADLLEFNADTDFGRRHGFAKLRDLDDYRAAVPVQDYSTLGPWIERMAAGEERVLTADRPAVYFTSSGTTGAHKKIPVTPRFMKTTFFPFYYAAWAPLAEHFPDVLTRPDAMLNLKHDPLVRPPTTQSGDPHVGASQVDFGAHFGEPLSAEPGTRAPWATLAVPVADNDHLEKSYLRLRLAAQSDVRGVIGINPAMVAAVPYQLGLWWPRMVREIRDGTLGGHPYGDPDPGRAAEIEALVDRHGTLRPAHLWPNLRVIFCWTTGLAALYLPRLREEFGIGVTVLPAPVAASEGPVAVALDRHGSAGSMVADACAYEFVDADTPLRPDVPTLTFDQVETGREYQVIFSHVGGLYRYAVGDVVRVVDHQGGVPRLCYAGRGTRSDAVGEALRDVQVVRALAGATGSTGLELRNAACRVSAPAGGPPHYEFALAGRSPWNADEIDRFGAALDAGLGAEATGYRDARGSGRLGTPTLTLLDPDAFLRDWQRSVAAGVRPTQVKDRMFRPDEAAWQRLTAPAGAAPVAGRPLPSQAGGPTR